jgi:hypothetical protein
MQEKSGVTSGQMDFKTNVYMNYNFKCEPQNTSKANYDHSSKSKEYFRDDFARIHYFLKTTG